MLLIVISLLNESITYVEFYSVLKIALHFSLYEKRLIFCNKIIWYLCALIVCHFPSDSWVLLYKMTPLPEPRLYWKRSSFPLNPSERKSPVPSCRGRFSLVQNRRPLSEYPRIFIWRLNCFPETLQVQNKRYWS